MAASGALERLQRWYLAQCNGDWEHSWGLEVHTLDNPGWGLKIDLAETELADRSFAQVETDRSNNDWLRCWVGKQAFEIACGPLNLVEGLEIFLDWAETPALE